jgi:hypothetical protein
MQTSNLSFMRNRSSVALHRSQACPTNPIRALLWRIPTTWSLAGLNWPRRTPKFLLQFHLLREPTVARTHTSRPLDRINMLGSKRALNYVYHGALARHCNKRSQLTLAHSANKSQLPVVDPRRFACRSSWPRVLFTPMTLLRDRCDPVCTINISSVTQTKLSKLE